MFTLIPPWAQLLIVVTVLGGTYTVGHHYGWQSRDNQAQLEAAAEAKADKDLSDHRAKADQQKDLDHAKEVARLQSIPPKVIHDRITQYVNSLCTSTGGMPPTVGESASLDPSPAVTDAAIRRTDLSADIVNAEINKATLVQCTAFVINHGFGPDK